MKKMCILFLLCLLMAGCGQAAEDTLEIAGMVGRYEGELEDGLPVGEGVFTGGDGWVYEGSFINGGFGTGHVTALPCEDGAYTGAVESLIPQGQGTLTLETGRFTGSFVEGRPHTGEAVDLPCRVFIGGTETDGFYTGPMAAALPEGEGSFRSRGGRSLSYEGGFAGGHAQGEGTLSDDGYLVSGQRGLYEGRVLNGLPEGEGSFRGRSADNVDFSYTGSWKDGLYDGEGELIYDSALYYDRVGHFSAGEFDPAPMELLAAIGSREPLFTLSAEQEAYLAEYPELMDAGREVPHYMQSDYRFLWDQTLNYARYMEAPAQYEESWLMFYNYVLLQSREIDSFGEGNRCTVFLACNTLYKEPAVLILFGDAGDLSAMRYVTGYGIPLGTTHYTSATGEPIEAVVALLGSAGGY
ncbi:MAG: hypothetical protein IJE26_05920 [Oscillospiraceae bacterium]|nr:hypothetical protein [Oscillospiraceae bacterium]